MRNIANSALVIAVREGVLCELPLTELKIGDIVLFEGRRLQLVTARSTAGRTASFARIMVSGEWAIHVRARERSLALPIRPNVPFGELAADRKPSVLHPDTEVDVLDLRADTS